VVTFSEAQLAQWLSPLLWTFLRVLAVFTSAPIFSSRSFSARTRIALAFFISLASQSGLPDAPVVPLDSPLAFGMVIQQVGVGLAIGFLVRLVFAAMELAGEVIGFQMGLNFAAFFDLSSGSQSSAIGRFYWQITALLFVVLNGHLMVIQGVVQSFELFPMDGNFMATLQRMRVHEFGRELFATGLWVALPLIGLLLFVNLGLGMVSRVAPQMNIYAIGFPLTLIAGLVGVASTLPMLDQPFVQLLELALQRGVGRGP
jgi:flagellar biosynthesis protein FliR